MLLTGSNNNDGPLSQIRNSILELRQELNGGGQNNREGVTNNTNHNNIQNNNNNYNPNAGSTVQLHYWRNSGNYHRVPEGFKWPSFNTSTMWNLWFFGDCERRIGPFKSIERNRDLTRACCKTNYTRSKLVINKLIDYAITGRIITTSNDISNENSQTVYDYAMPLLVQELYQNEPHRPIDININTLGNRM
jgi:hypothetical protein